MAFNVIIEDNLDKQRLRKEFESYLDNIAPTLNLHDLDDWGLALCVSFSSTDKIGAGKRSVRYLSEKEFEVSVSVPIPNEENICYGIAKSKEIYSNPTNEKYFYIMDPCYDEYHDLFSYVVASSKKAIDLLFSRGVTCKGKKIKIQN